MMPATKPQIIASTIGFEQPQWNSHYYPEECPLEWRIAYFMNDFRAVYLPAEAWSNQPPLLEHIADELDPGFELVLEWPRGDTHSIDALLAQLSPLKQNIVNIVLNVRDPADQSLLHTLQIVSETYPISLRGNIKTDTTLITIARQHHASIVWQPEHACEPALGAGYQVVLLPCQNLRAIKSTLDKLKKLLLSGVRIGLFFEPAPDSPQRAMETRELIELLGLA